MKFKIFILIIFSLVSCNSDQPEPNFYRNEFTGEILTKLEFEQFNKNLVPDTAKEKSLLGYIFPEIIKHGDSIIQPFKYDLRIDNKYIQRSMKYDKIGLSLKSHKFNLLNGESLIIGGKTDKPTFINLWFTTCSGCIKEIPILNEIQEKYKNKINFIAITFNEEKEVKKFLEKKEFNFKHLVNQKEFIEKIASHPYPENILIDKNGTIRYIEPQIIKYEINYFEEIIEKLL